MERVDLDKDVSEFVDHSQLEKIFGKKAGLVGRFDPKELFTWHNLDELLSSQRLSPPRLRLAQQNLPSDKLSSFVSTTIGRRGVELPRVHPEELTSVLVEGATLVLDAVDEFSPELRRLVRGFARSFASVPQINLYACFGDDPGFGIHWDDHDVFIFQLDGKKHWKIFEPTRLSPCYRDIESPPELTEGQSAYFDEMLYAGQILYVPRGHWHDVLGINERSLHLTLGITHPTASDILTWLADEMKVYELVRRDLPLFSEDDQRRFSCELIGLREQDLALLLCFSGLYPSLIEKIERVFLADVDERALLLAKLFVSSELLMMARNYGDHPELIPSLKRQGEAARHAWLR